MSANIDARAVAEAAMAVLGSAARISTPQLLDRLRAQFPTLRGEALGHALTDAGWQPSQWRVPSGGRTRGYMPPAVREIEAEEIAPPAPQPQAHTGADGVKRAIGAAARVTASAGVVGPATGMSSAPPLFVPGHTSPGPHAGNQPPAEPCRCGSRRWWRARFQSQGWRCLGCSHPAGGDQVVVVEMAAPPTLAPISAPAPIPPQPPEVLPPIIQRATVPLGTRCAQCGASRWWPNYASTPPTWTCIQCLPGGERSAASNAGAWL